MQKESFVIPNKISKYTISINTLVKSTYMEFESLIEWISRTTFKSSTTFYTSYIDFFHKDQIQNGENTNYVSSIKILYIDEDHVTFELRWENGETAIVIGRL